MQTVPVSKLRIIIIIITSFSSRRKKKCVRFTQPGDGDDGEDGEGGTSAGNGAGVEDEAKPQESASLPLSSSIDTHPPNIPNIPPVSSSAQSDM